MQMLEINQLKCHPRNDYFFDDITGEKWEDFKSSILRRGVVEPIVVTQDLIVVSGHQRVRACKELQLLTIPCRITHYPDIDEKTGTSKEDMIVEDLISTNIMQRGVGNINAMKMARCIIELERIKGIKNGGDRGNQYTFLADEHNDDVPTQSDLANQLGITQQQLGRYKKLTTLIPELQDLVETGELKATVGYSVLSKLSTEEQQEILNKIGRDNIKDMTQKEVKSYIEENDRLKDDIEEYKNKVNDLLSLKNKIDRLENELNNRPTIEVSVNPSDYDDLKKKANDKDNNYNSLRNEYDKKAKEMQQLQEEVKSLKDTYNSEPEKYKKRLKDNALTFCTKCQMFFEQTAGLAWLAEEINELPEYERKSYIKAVELMDNWVLATKSNMKSFLYK